MAMTLCSVKVASFHAVLSVYPGQQSEVNNINNPVHAGTRSMAARGVEETDIVGIPVVGRTNLPRGRPDADERQAGWCHGVAHEVGTATQACDFLKARRKRRENRENVVRVVASDEVWLARRNVTKDHERGIYVW